MAVQPQTPYKEYTANGSTKSFALEFDCYNQDHLIVLVDDVEEIVGTWSLSNGAVVFGSAPASGKKITIQRNTPFRRDGDFQSYDNSFRPGPVNKGFDWIWLKLQELGVADWILNNRIDALKNYVDDRDDELRAYLLAEIQAQGVALDQLEDYYNYLMQRLAQIAVDKGWDASFVVYDGINQKTINDGLNSIAELVGIDNPQNNMRVMTKSYHAPQYVYAKPFNGGSTYIYNATMPKTNHNGGTVIASGKTFPEDWTVRADVEAWFTAPTTENGCWVAVSTNSQIDVTIFGAMPNFNLGVDNSIAANKALAVKNNIVFPEGNFIVHRPILTDKAFPIIGGAGGESTLITVEDANWQGVTFNGKTYNAAIVVTSGVQGSWIEGATLEDFSLLGNSYTADGKIGIDFDNVCLKVNVKNVNISAFDKGIHTFKSWVHSYNNVTVTDCITNSMHFDTFANGYSLTGVCLYGRSVKTLCHLKFENACYGNSFNGGAIEHCWIGVSTRNNAQVNITGVDWEVIDQLFMENVDCVGLPSKIDSCSIMGNPSQSGFGVTNGQLVLENNKIFNPLGSQNIDNPIYFVDGTGGVVANNNEYGAHTTLIGGSGKIIGNDVGRYDFRKSKRIADSKILDAYEEKHVNYFEFFTNTGVPYPRISESFVETKIGNFHNIKVQTLLNKLTTISGDYLTFTIADLTGDGLVGSFVFSKTANILSSDAITGSIYSSSGVCYLIKPTGGLLLKADLNATTDTNLFRLQINYNDSI